ncbi:MAG: cell division protein ZapA [Thermodesulfobacteriota bacterium]
MDELITIELFGQRYTFKAEAGVQGAEEVADLLAREVAIVEHQIDKTSMGMNKMTILILAGLNISSEYIELKRKYNELLQHISARSALLASRIDLNLQ